MTVHYTETQVIAAVTRLTPKRLSRFVQAEFVTPVLSDTGPKFRDIDRVRLELLCELSDDFDLDEDALGVIISLIDQLHSVRSDLRRVLSAVQQEPTEVRERIAKALAGV
ncbi:hypothetical protein [Sedimentitalea arenosa]|uniref:Chaperone modulatory protein CbpM n=1 Tax=Sedimentitalea arenosa TaxID=2798803 RepID=A0A8J7J6X2_9RHOB|nr:hypothetical protein [Arenibacterium arenosum]MBJ6372470.1 hypothetical protein [Arenibacterium arenosum]